MVSSSVDVTPATAPRKPLSDKVPPENQRVKCSMFVYGKLRACSGGPTAGSRPAAGFAPARAGGDLTLGPPPCRNQQKGFA